MEANQMAVSPFLVHASHWTLLAYAVEMAVGPIKVQKFNQLLSHLLAVRRSPCTFQAWVSIVYPTWTAIWACFIAHGFMKPSIPHVRDLVNRAPFLPSAAYATPDIRQHVVKGYPWFYPRFPRQTLRF